MRTLKNILVATLIMAASAIAVAPANARGSYGQRQYYGSWNYSNSHSYYFTTYYYRPVTTVTVYSYHYCVYYPSQPRYVYYYNPTSQVYWGRYDLEKKGYSLLAVDDRKAKLEDIPESAFPQPAEMPPVPESNGDAKVIPVSVDSLPKFTSSPSKAK